MHPHCKINNPISVTIIGIVTLMTVACGRHDTSAIYDTVLQPVDIDSVDISEYTINPCCLATADSVLIIESTRRHVIFDSFRLPSLQHIGSGVTRGQAPDELINPDFLYLGNYHRSMTISDCHEGIVAIINPEKPAVSGHIRFRLPEDWTYLQHLYLINDSLALVQCGDGKLQWSIIRHDGTQLCEITPSLPTTVSEHIGDNEFAEMLVRTGYGVYSDSLERFAIVHAPYEAIEIYSFDGKVIARMEGQLIEPDGKTFVMGAVSDGDSFYVNFHDPVDKSLTRSFIVKYDWNGNMLSRYDIPRFVTSFCISHIDRRIYFASYPECDFLYYFNI